MGRKEMGKGHAGKKWASGLKGGLGLGVGVVGVGGEPSVAKAAAITLIFDPFFFLVEG